MLPGRARFPGWLAPFLAALLAWNALVLLGALASYGDAQHTAVHASFALTLLRFVLLHLPLAAFGLIMVAACGRVAGGRPTLSRLALAWSAASLVFLPLLCIWQCAINNLIGGKPLGTVDTLIRQQPMLAWWFNALMLLIACGAHMASLTWGHAHAQALASQRAQQANLALRLRLLQGQLEPYFLSGALAGISRLGRAGQREQATRALARLSELLRYALRASQADWRSVADEVQFMRDYAELQNLCRGGTLALQWRLEDCDWNGYRCPPLLLFPMLEQALGVSGDVTVCIARVQRGRATVVQADISYPGAAIPVKSEALAAMEQRLAMLYGGAAAFSVQADGDLSRLVLTYPALSHDD